MLCNVNSKFVTFIAKHYDESIAITFVDTLIRYIYTVNDKIGSSLNAKMLTPMPQELHDITQDRINRCNGLIKRYHTGDILTS